jgi:hypothetical protein
MVLTGGKRFFQVARTAAESGFVPMGCLLLIPVLSKATIMIRQDQAITGGSRDIRMEKDYQRFV